MTASGAHADCRLRAFGEFSLRPNPSRLLIEGAVNGKPVVFIADTGAWISSMSFTDAHRLGVQVEASSGMVSEGIGGQVNTGKGRFDMKLGQLDLPREEMTVMSSGSLDNDAAALVGLDLLAQHDLELDLPDNKLRLIKIDGCTPAQIVYWNKPYSQAKLETDGSIRPPILVNVMLNGHLIPAEIDSGAPQTIVTGAAARAAGVDVEKALPQDKIGGIGARRIEAGVVRFDSFTIGDETIKNVELIVSDMWKYNKVEETGTRLGSHTHSMGEPRMLLGADFLRAHRVLVANSLGMMVFSYMGGPIFDTSRPTAPAPETSPPQTAAKTPVKAPAN